MTGAIIHEWIEPFGGAERVLDAMVEIFPRADLYCLWNDDPTRFPGKRIFESSLARSKFRNHKALALPFMPHVWHRLRPHEDYEWMLISSHLFAHQARFLDLSWIPKFVYVHTPARYVWDPGIDVRGHSIPVRAASVPLRMIDRYRAREITSVAANSDFVRQRIQRAWKREACVIYPPVDVENIMRVPDWTAEVIGTERAILECLPETFLLGASRFVQYKDLDVVIRIGTTAGLPVVIAGDGPERKHLVELANRSGGSVLFVDKPSDTLLRALYQQCYAYVFPPIEDFGIMPVEAMACGTPVLVSAIGGAAESVSLCQGGVVMEDWEPATVETALRRVSEISRTELPAKTAGFSRQSFMENLRNWMTNVNG